MRHSNTNPCSRLAADLLGAGPPGPTPGPVDTAFLHDVAMALHGLVDRGPATLADGISFHVSSEGGHVRVSAEAREQERLLAAATVVGVHGRVRSSAWTERDRRWVTVPVEPSRSARPAANPDTEDRPCSARSRASYAPPSSQARRPPAPWPRYPGFTSSRAARP